MLGMSALIMIPGRQRWKQSQKELKASLDYVTPARSELKPRLGRAYELRNSDFLISGPLSPQCLSLTICQFIFNM